MKTLIWPMRSGGDGRLLVGGGWPPGRQLDLGQEFLPLPMTRGIESPLDAIVRTGAWLERLLAKCHARLGDALAALAMVAGPAGRNDVIPRVETATRTRN